MRDFSWQYFSLTGDVDAYLLYKEINMDSVSDETDEDLNDESEDTLQ
ncbi:YqzL family protein [Paenibacillus agricola]|uniref:YqzL family protein n=1 Tax=Paenibacillus agricola TaxID=2716264 RepID=A0ABX0J7T2_9BACL|nr:YqzL family protein [Paenibacillus agricola]NHN30927.1 YqzL family protein [Paenibacillus agricola]